MNIHIQHKIVREEEEAIFTTATIVCYDRYGYGYYAVVLVAKLVAHHRTFNLVQILQCYSII